MSWRTGLASFMKRLLVATVAVAVFCAAVEGALRLFRFQYKPRERALWIPTVADFIGTYEIYVPTHLSPPGYFWMSQPNTALTDSYGFRKPEIPFKKEPGKIRVAFLGGSTTQGGIPEYAERAIRLINNAIGTNRYEKLNAGCSSYSSHQSLIALDRYVLSRDADIALIYHGWNDSAVPVDGYSDHEKDLLAGLGSTAKGSGMAWVRQLRMTQGMGKVMDWADRSWPRIRVPPEQFEKNMRAMVEHCLARRVLPVVVIRPYTQKRPLPDIGEMALDCGEHMFGTRDKEEIYRKTWETYAGILWKVVKAYPEARPCDAYAFINDAQARCARGEYGEGVEVFTDDSCHLYPFGNELLGQCVALSLAPEHAEAINRYIRSAAYFDFLAQEALQLDRPFDAVYYAKQGLAADAQNLDLYNERIKQAEAKFEFVRLFTEARWGGPDKDLDSKLAKLKRCLDMRPADLGLVIQIFRVSLYMNHPERAADIMAGFQPTDLRQQYEWLNMMLQSLAAAQRWVEARNVAAQILKINPNDGNAQALLNAVRM